MGLESDLIPEGRTVIGSDPFNFNCHSGVSCCTNCGRKRERDLYPYDVLRLKKSLGMHSAEFMHAHTRIAPGSHPYFPAVMLNMQPNEEQACPFLTGKGCSVYRDRPSACRTYPLERGVERQQDKQTLIVHYFMTHHEYCKGHHEEREYTIKQWERDQFLDEFNTMNDLWAEVDAFLGTNPWQGEGTAGPRQQLAFMVCYNLDDFRGYAEQHNLLKSFRLDRDRRRRIARDDTELLKFGFDWLQFVLGDRPTLIPK